MNQQPSEFIHKAYEKFKIKPGCGNQSIFLRESTLLFIHKQFKKPILKKHLKPRSIFLVNTSKQTMKKYLDFSISSLTKLRN